MDYFILAKSRMFLLKNTMPLGAESDDEIKACYQLIKSC